MNLGRLLQALGQPDAGHKLLEHAYQVLTTQLGPQHRYTRQLGSQLGKDEPGS